MFKKPKLARRQLMCESGRLVGPPTVTNISDETMAKIRDKMVGYDSLSKIT